MTCRRDARAEARKSSRLRSRRRTIALVLISIVVGALNAEAASVTLAWTEPTTNAGWNTPHGSRRLSRVPGDGRAPALPRRLVRCGGGLELNTNDR